MLNELQAKADLRTEQRSAKRFCVTVVGTLALIWTLVAALNYLVDPYAQYGLGLVPPVVQTSRAEKLALMNQMVEPPAGLIFGSSRVLKLEPAYLEALTNHPFLNVGVNYAKPEDYLAILRYYQKHFGRLPEMVVVGLDVAAFSDGQPVDARLLGLPELARLIPEATNIADRFQRYQELLSWQQTRHSIDSLRRYCRWEARPPAESFQPDGLIVYHERDEQIANGTYDFNAAIDYNKREYEQIFSSFTELSPRRCQFFELFVRTCRESGCRLVVFTTPMHPQLADHLRETTDYAKRRQELIRYVDRLATRYHFDFHELSTLESFAGSDALFVDGIHPLELNTRRMIDRLIEPSPRRSTYAVQ